MNNMKGWVMFFVLPFFPSTFLTSQRLCGVKIPIAQICSPRISCPVSSGYRSVEVSCSPCDQQYDTEKACSPGISEDW